ncbi:LSM-domain-containing protein [Nadsonia fulvescens var. elongata DSM 6958]|uniref:Sm protein B n=1 Tax=Nadsonia fulvescens var. elongata DSM 6958 TaxID=857566 RepID=A0A1E3PR15_9ASCO|nr:LSM-domain-containing protein [Nadsonia fulvescens var. elongata DSM 6958]
MSRDIAVVPNEAKRKLSEAKINSSFIMSTPRRAKMADLIHYRLRVVSLDGKELTGQLLAFDKFMNLVLADSEEFRLTKRNAQLLQQQSTVSSSSPTASASSTASTTPSSTASTIAQEKRTLGLVIIRGETIVSISIESPPSHDQSSRLKKDAIRPGHGTSKPIGRSMGPGTGTNALSGPMRMNNQGSAPVGGNTNGPPRGFGGPPRGFGGPPPTGNGPPRGFGAAPPGFRPPPGFGR